jgi:hypothetical protein
VKTRKGFALAALVLVLALAACGGGDKTTAVVPTEGTTGSQPAGATAAVGAKATTGVSPTEAADIAPTAAAEGDLSLDSVSTGLAQLKSYKSKLDMRFTGTDAQGQKVDKSWTMEEAFIVEPRAQQIGWSGSEATGGQAPTVTKWVTINVAGTSYMVSTDADGKETCISYTAQDQAPPEAGLTPDMWGSISDAKFVGTDNVNGVRAKHYTWKEGALVLWGFTQGKGETWVAIDGGYVVKQSIEATGKGVFLAGTDEEGTTTWEWDVTDANGSFKIEPPPGCESAASDIPVMADATDKATFGDMTSYSTPSALADVVAFYKAEMPKAGWKATGTPTEMEGFSSLEFEKEGNTAAVMISTDTSTNQTSVIITITKQ